jgi:ribulose-5-phosphate 4-epimerase/fuculose-1-phosphate aldolase
MTNLATVPLESYKDKCFDIEWQTRLNLAACYRLVDMMGMSDLINSHISARIPGTEEILINPYGWLFEEITASSLVKINLAGEILGRAAPDLGINHAGYVVHSAVHEARADLECVIHTHTRAGCAVAALKCGLLPISQKAMRFHGKISYHPYEGPAVELAERKRLQEHLGANDYMILYNHGLLACGKTIPEAFNAMMALERACQIQVDAMACNSELIYPSEEVKATTARLFEPHVRRPYGIKEWPAMLRMLDRRDPSYRD